MGEVIRRAIATPDLIIPAAPDLPRLTFRHDPRFPVAVTVADGTTVQAVPRAALREAMMTAEVLGDNLAIIVQVGGLLVIDGPAGYYEAPVAKVRAWVERTYEGFSSALEAEWLALFVDLAGAAIVADGAA